MVGEKLVCEKGVLVGAVLMTAVLMTAVLAAVLTAVSAAVLCWDWCRKPVFDVVVEGVVIMWRP